MNGEKVKQLKKQLIKSLGRTPNQSEFRRFKKDLKNNN